MKSWLCLFLGHREEVSVIETHVTTSGRCIWTVAYRCTRCPAVTTRHEHGRFHT